MPADLFAIPAPALLAADGARFPLRRVYAIGRNYADHAREMGGDPGREPPFFFMKPADAVVAVAADGTGVVAYPPLTDDLHHEVELVVALRAGGRDIAPADALDRVWGYGVGLDLTRRDRQAEAKAAGRPWEVGKSFDGAAPIGALVSAAAFGPPTAGAITLDVNGARRQQGDLADMTWSVAELVAELSRWSALAAGDVIMTGTPAGVGPVRRGDRLVGTIRDLPSLSVAIV